MKLMIIRHAEPDYEHDSLTEEGFKEAKALASMLKGEKIDKFFISPLGRAQDTANETLKLIGREAKTLPWLKEFEYPIEKGREDPYSAGIAWDWFPSDWTKKPEYFSKDEWYNPPEMKDGHIKEHYDEVCSSLDALLEAEAGYKRDGLMYSCINGNNDTYAFFCHFGLEAVLLSHLLNISPMVLWHGTCALPSSVTTVVTEERVKGEAYWRMLSFGDLSHLRLAGLEPSFAARFCECYENEDERH